MTLYYQTALHIFRRDLRVPDNTALMNALAMSEHVIPCFIFDKRQIEQNEYKSDNCVQFMLQSLQDLHNQLQKRKGKLYYFYGTAEEIVAQFCEQKTIQAVFLNRDYTPFSRSRDNKIKEICEKHKVDFHCFADALLHEPEEIHKPNREPYTVYTHFYNKANIESVAPPKKNNRTNYYQDKIAFENHDIMEKLLQKNNPNLLLKGGREEALNLLRKIPKFKNYEEMRNFPAVDGTTKLSAHNKFGTLSIRELYHTILNHFSSGHTLIKELYWRDFFTHIAYHFPRVFDQAFQKKYAKIKWSANEKHFRAWCEGKTGFPIVDAGMRELNATGYMHNRVRMITASFLVKDLQIDWRWGEKYFAQKLVDYDPAVNNGNWQWAASTGCDAQPYFRIFNPWLQQKKFDADCVYIKKWIPELSAATAKQIHQLEKNQSLFVTSYPAPIINHAESCVKTKRLFESVSLTV